MNENQFQIKSRTELSETSIIAATDIYGRVWTLVATAGGEDVIITPQGEAIDPMGATVPTIVGLFIEWLAVNV